MEDGQQQVVLSGQSHDDEWSLTMLPAGICALLQEEWFLRMVFEHLVDSGLEDCRLVCHKWRDVCQWFPVKLTPKTPEQLEQAMAAFPNATSLTLMFVQGRVKDTTFFTLLSTTHKLTTLEFFAGVLELTGDVRHQFQSITRLRRLTLHCNRIRGDLRLLDSVRYLTNLSSLRISFTDWDPPPVKPFVELKEIRSLKVSSALVVDATGACFFPSLTRLTSLQLSTPPGDAEVEVALSLEVLRFRCTGQESARPRVGAERL